MALPNIFQQRTMQGLKARIQQLSSSNSPQWGIMNAPQMLAHINVMFELALEDRHPRPNAFIRFMLKSLVKNKIVSDKPYVKNSRTAPEMVITHQPDFKTEQARLLQYLEQLDALGAETFAGKEHPSFGPLSTTEWSNAFYKHIDHHLNQFAV